MKPIALCVTACLVLGAVRAQAQQPRAGKPAAARKTAPDNSASLSQLNPEMWLYEQELRRHDDPKMAVRRKAEFKMHQRQQRIAAMEWYGFNNSRPVISPAAWNGGFESAGWISNSYNHPLDWSGGTATLISVRRSGNGGTSGGIGLW